MKHLLRIERTLTLIKFVEGLSAKSTNYKEDDTKSINEDFKNFLNFFNVLQWLMPKHSKHTKQNEQKLQKYPWFFTALTKKFSKERNHGCLAPALLKSIKIKHKCI